MKTVKTRIVEIKNYGVTFFAPQYKSWIGIWINIGERQHSMEHARFTIKSFLEDEKYKKVHY